MNKYVTSLLAVVGALAFASVALAQAPAGGGGESFSIDFTKYFGAAVTTCGAAYGIGKLASAALESMARQPEVASQIQTAMIIAAALIEGFTFFALVICFI